MITSRQAGGWPTILGLVISLFAAPAVALIFKMSGFTRADNGAVVARTFFSDARGKRKHL
jgi:hypothetical protein